MDREQIKKKLIFWYAILWILLSIALWESYGLFFPDTTSTKSKWLGLFAGSIFVLLSAAKNCELSYFFSNNKIIENITRYFKNGLNFFYKTAAKYIIFIAFIVGIILNKYLKTDFTICYACGVAAGLFCLFGLNSLCCGANAKITYAINSLSKNTYRMLFSSGVMISGFCLGLTISTIVILFHIFKDYQTISGFCLGLALVVFINTTSTTISKKGTLGADYTFVNTEDGLERNDKRNPLLLIKGISKANFTINSTAMELTNAFIATMVASMNAGGYCYNLMGAFLPIIIAASGIFSSVILILLHKRKANQSPTKAMFLYSFLNCVLLTVIGYYVIKCWFPDEIHLLCAIIIGAFGGLILTFLNFKQIEKRYKVAKSISNTTTNGLPSLVFKLIDECTNGVFLPSIIFAIIIISSFLTGYGMEAPTFGIFAITISILSFISTVGLNLSYNVFAYGAIGANAINECYEEDLNGAQNINLISQEAHNLIVLGKNFINSITILSAIGILIGYTISAEIDEIDILNPYVMGALLIGASIPFFYCSIIIKAANKTALRLIFEAKKHFKHFPSILNYQMRPDYEGFAKTLATSSSIHTTIIFVLCVAIFFTLGNFLLKEALAGFIVSIILSSGGLILALNHGENLISGTKKYFVSEYQNAKYTNEYGMISQTDKLLRILGDLLIPSVNSLLIFITILALATAPIYMSFQCNCR